MSSLSPAVVAATQDLELAARIVVEGLRAGGHRSPYHGFSAEFQQHRPYRAGDDLKYLDWKLLARTDRLYSRQFRETTSMSVMLVVDTSASMAFPENGVSKARYAAILAAALAYLVVTGGDAVGLVASVQGRFEYVPARSGRAHLRGLIARLDSLQSSGTWNAASAIMRGAELLRRRGLVLVISDLYDDEEATRTALRRVARSGHDVAALQLTSAEERTLPYSGTVEFADMETGQRRIVDADAAGSTYRNALVDFHQRCRAAAHRDGIDYALLSTADPPESALREYLLRRASPVAAHGARAPLGTQASASGADDNA